MSTGHPALVEWMRAEIRERGPQGFAWFMQQALYHPEFGYYSSDRALIGRCGDYFSNVSVGPLFGRLLAAQFHEIWERLGRIDNFVIVEQGAHHAQFARDVLEWAERKCPQFFAALRFTIVEPFPILRARQQETFGDFAARVRWRASLDDLESFVGVHFSNELLDSMPVNLQHKLVGLVKDKFVFVDSPTRQVTNQSQLDWIDKITTRLERGFVLAIDYGFPRSEFQEMVQVRAKHRLLGSPFEEIGRADITAHINWTDIGERAEKKRLGICGFTDQHHFLTGIISSCPEIIGDKKSGCALRTLLHPEMLGRSFQVLGLVKDAEAEAVLNGFKFARSARESLGL